MCAPKNLSMAKIGLPKKQTVHHIAKSTYWFLVGFTLSGILLASAILFYFQYNYKNKVIPGVFIDNVYIGEKTKTEIEDIFSKKNQKIGENTFIFSTKDTDATISAKTIDIGYDIPLIVEQSMTLGKSKNLLSDAYIILSSYVNGTFLNSSYTFNENQLKQELESLHKSVYVEPINAQFQIENNKVVAFRNSTDGKTIDFEKLTSELHDDIPQLIKSSNSKLSRIDVPIKTLEPDITTEEVNEFGIIEQIGVGKSTFLHSIPNRVFNISLAASRINGILVAPGEEFSFVKALGDVSKFTGYKEAYVISGGKTVLGDGGGVCQVSTTLFRALLDAGLPITERHAHAYRVGYYEQDAPPGLDATVYVPSVDLKFKNDTGKHVLIQSYVDPVNYALTFTLYGKKDGRTVELSTPTISNVSAAPAPLYQDDPTLPVGVEKQVDFAAPGAKSVFTRTVIKDGKTLHNDTFVSSYRPWQAVFLRGTATQ